MRLYTRGHPSPRLQSLIPCSGACAQGVLDQGKDTSLSFLSTSRDSARPPVLSRVTQVKGGAPRCPSGRTSRRAAAERTVGGCCHVPGNPLTPLNLYFPGAVHLCLPGTRQVAASLPREAGELTPTSCPLAWASLVKAGESGCF